MWLVPPAAPHRLCARAAQPEGCRVCLRGPVHKITRARVPTQEALKYQGTGGPRARYLQTWLCRDVQRPSDSRHPR